MKIEGAKYGTFGGQRLTKVQGAFVNAPYYYETSDGSLVPMDTCAITGRGFGKSEGALARIYRYGQNFPGSSMAVFRQTNKSLKPLRDSAEDKFYLEDPGGTFNKQDGIFYFSNGSSVIFDALADRALYRNHQGASYQLIFLDEIQQWAEPTLPDLLLSNLRGPDDQPCFMMYGGNAGDKGHFWMVDRWLPIRRPKVSVFRAENNRPTLLFQGNWQDNVDPHTKKNNNGENYPETLEASTSDPLVLAMWLSGDVNIVGGRYFSDVLSEHNFVTWYQDDHWWNCEDDWRRYLAMDHGTRRPTVFLGLAEALRSTRGLDGTLYHKGDLVAVWEMSNATRQNLKVSDGSTIPEVCDRTKRLCADWNWPRWGVGDDATFYMTGHPTPTAQLYAESGIEIREAGKGNRRPGWDAVRALLKEARPDGQREKRALYINEHACPHLAFSIRNITAKERDFSDVDTDSYDDALDALRYGVVGRPPPPPSAQNFWR